MDNIEQKLSVYPTSSLLQELDRRSNLNNQATKGVTDRSCSTVGTGESIKTTYPQGLEMKYFVLKPKGTDIFAKASRKAMRAYAMMIVNDNYQLANDLRNWADREQEAVIAKELDKIRDEVSC